MSNKTFSVMLGSMDWKPVTLLEKEFQNILQTIFRNFKKNCCAESMLENLFAGKDSRPATILKKKIRPRQLLCKIHQISISSVILTYILSEKAATKFVHWYKLLHTTALSKFYHVLWYNSKSSFSRNLDKFPFKRSCRLTVCRLQKLLNTDY